MPRAVIMGLDTLERRISFVGGAIAMVLSAVLAPHLFKNTWITDTATPGKNNSCVKPYHLVGSLCEHRRLTHPSDWLLQFLMIFIIGLAILAFAWWRRRVGVAFGGLFLGLALGTIGLPFLFLGGWLVIRALRLQRTGDPSLLGSARKAREQRDAAKAGRANAGRARGGRASAEPAGASPSRPSAPPAPSKRYTPKKQTRRR